MLHGMPRSEDVIRLEVLGRFVANSLKEAHKKNIAPIAFPILGSGDIPTDVIGEVMFEELCEFCCMRPDTKLRDLRFVVHPEDDKAAEVSISH